MPSTSKSELREEARRRRAALARSVTDFAERLCEHAGALGIADGSLVGAYAALRDEADPHLLLKRLARAGCTFALPRVAQKNAPLVFHRWTPGQAMEPGWMGVPEPMPDWPVAHPRILLVPLLAYDDRGHRLGYGGGYYDRTLAALSGAALPRARAIGIAYAGQQVDFLPHDAHDCRLDAVLTENGLTDFTR